MITNYWYPLYAYIRRRTRDEHEAQDLTQAFFTQLLEKQTFAAADPERGRFRAFLLTACKRFLMNELQRKAAVKRGGHVSTLSLDFVSAEERYRIEPADVLTPERLFEQQWTQELLNRVLVQIRAEFVQSRPKSEFELLKPFLQGSATRTYAAVAVDLGISESAAKVTVHRLRQKFRDILRHEIAQTVDSAAEIDDELCRLLQLLN